MMITLLTTKLYFPPARTNLVSRPRLLEMLNRGLKGRLTLIAAPAGYGKTTLMTEWHAGRGKDVPAAWFSIDASDNDPVRFWSYLVSALDSLQSGIVGDALSMLESPQLPPIESLLTLLINDLAVYQKDFVLVLDDVHIIAAPEIHHGIDFLLEHMPLCMHIVLLTRADPPIALSRLRANGQLVEIRARDLNFNSEETAAFLNDMMKLELSADEIVALEARTEGWIAGLQLAALSLQGQKDTANIIATFGGGYHYIVDFLVEEVLNNQPEPLRKFLLQTSILDRLSGQLCDALTGQTNGDTTLQQLEQGNLFIFPLGGECCWYRYHHLFADVLRNRLRQAYREQLPELHIRAARWFDQNGYSLDAIHHALTVPDYEYAAQLIEQNADAMLVRGELITLLNLIESIEHLLQTRPWLAIQRAWAFTYTGQLNLVEPTLEIAEKYVSRHTSIPNLMNINGNIAAIRAYNAAIMGNASQTLDYAQQALKLLPANNISTRSIVSFVLGGAYRLKNDSKEAMYAWTAAARDSQMAGNLYLAVSATSAQADILLDQGKLHLAVDTYNKALHIGIHTDARRMPVAARALAGLGNVYYEWNDLETAFKYANQCISLCRLWGNPDTLIEGHLLLIKLWQAHGDLEKAQEAMREAEILKQSHNLRPGSASHVDHSLVRLWLAQGNMESLNRWARETRIKGDEQSSHSGVRECSLLARILLDQGKPAESLKLVDQVLKLADADEHPGQTIELLLVQALAYQATGDATQALGSLQRALSFAETEGYARVFLDMGNPIKVLLQKALTSDDISRYAGKILTMFDEKQDDTSNTRQAMLDQLSTREVEVLELIALGKTNQQIADELVIALGTAKRHVFNIYSKLEVKNRTECVAKARSLHILK